jgi:hypothetical protein
VRSVLLIVALALAGCGRLGFDALSAGSEIIDSGATSDDGAGSARLVDGGSVGSGAASVTLTGVYLISGDGVGPTSVLTLDVGTGDVALVGTIAGSVGFLSALAWWDTNTLYAVGGGQLVEITLAPFSANVVATITTDTIAGMFGYQPYLELVDATTSQLLIFTPSDPSSVTTKPLGIPISGGDIAPTTFGGSYYFSNANQELYAIYTATGNSEAVGSAPNATGIAGMFQTDDFTDFYLTSSLTDAVIPIDISTGALGIPIPLCHPCPATPYDLLDGDADSAH